MSAIVGEARLHTIERHVSTPYARAMVSKALYDVLLEAIDFGPRELPSAADREALRIAASAALQEATDVAIRALIWRVTVAIDHAPPEVRERFDRSHYGEEFGLD
ncbi:MAG: hypothetical protein ACHQ3P_00645 [Candidatus Limnocylindrales bacterium]